MCVYKCSISLHRTVTVMVDQTTPCWETVVCVGLWIIMWLHMKPSASHGGERPWAKGENLGHEHRA